MSWRLGTLAAVLAWLFLASPAVLAAAERADCGIEVRNGTRTQNLAHLTRSLLSLQGFNVVQIGNYIDFGAAATVIYYRAGAEKVARALRSEIFPGAGIEESSRLKNGVDIKVLLGHDLEVQPRMMARLLGEELPASPPAVKAPTPEPGPPPRSLAAQKTAALASVRAPAAAGPDGSPSQAPPPLPAAAAAAKSGASQRRIVLAAAERADTGIEVLNGTRTQNLAHLTRSLLSLQGFNVVLIGNYIDFGVEATVIYYRTGAEKVARALQSEIFPGARIEESSRLKNGVDVKVLLGHDLEVQPRIMARLLGEDLPAPTPAVKAPEPEPGPPPRPLSAQAMVVPPIVSAPAAAGPESPTALHPAASTAESGAIQLPSGTAAPSQPPPSQPDSPNVRREAMITEPRRSQSGHVRLLGQTEETYTPESVPDAIRQACQELALGEAPAPEFDGVVAVAEQAAAAPKPADLAMDDNSRLVRQVAQDQGVKPAPAPQPAAPITAAAVAPDDIQIHRDAGELPPSGSAAPSQPPPSQPDSPNVRREAMITEPRRRENRHALLVGQTEETYTPESVLDAIRQACQELALGEAPAPEFDGVVAAAEQAAAPQKQLPRLS